jgi:hypothetical protein
MWKIIELILYYVPVTLVSCIVYASVKRNSMSEIMGAGLRYFAMFTGLIVVLIAVIEIIGKLAN